MILKMAVTQNTASCAHCRANGTFSLRCPYMNLTPEVVNIVMGLLTIFKVSYGSLTKQRILNKIKLVQSVSVTKSYFNYSVIYNEVSQWKDSDINSQQILSLISSHTNLSVDAINSIIETM